MLTPRQLLARAGTYAVLLSVSAVVLFPIYAVVVMSVSQAPGFSAVVSPDWSALTLDHFRRFLLATDAQGRWLFGRQFLNSVVSFLKNEDGPTAVEYAVMLALIIVVCMTAITALGTNANNTFNYVNTQVGKTGS